MEKMERKFRIPKFPKITNVTTTMPTGGLFPPFFPKRNQNDNYPTRLTQLTILTHARALPTGRPLGRPTAGN